MNCSASAARPICGGAWSLAGDAQLALCTQLADELLGDIRGLVQQMRLHDGVDIGATMRRFTSSGQGW